MGSSNSTPSTTYQQNVAETNEAFVIRSNGLETEITTPNKINYYYLPVFERACVLSIKASNDAHIGISTDRRTNFVEITIGASRNIKTIIWKGGYIEVWKETPNILSPHVYRKFWLIWRNQTIMLGRGDENEPFISYKFSNDPLQLNFVGICTSNGSTGRWIIDQSSQTISSLLGRSSRSSTGDASTSYNVPDTKNKNEASATDNCNQQTNNNIDLNSTVVMNELENFFNGKDYTLNESNNSSNNSKNEVKANNRMDKKQYTSKQNKNTQEKHISERPSNKIIEFTTILEISRKSPELIIFELKEFKFEELFEVLLSRSYINIIMIILAKLCEADFLRERRAVPINFFSKEMFRKQILNYIHKIPTQPEAEFKKYSKFTYAFLNDLYIVCNTAANIETDLKPEHLLKIITDCHSTLKKLDKDAHLLEILYKFNSLRKEVEKELEKSA